MAYKTDGKGSGGSVEIVATNVEVTNGGQIETSVFGEGRAGSVLIDVSETVLVDGINPITGDNSSNIGSSIQADGKGSGGSVEIAATNVEVTNGGQIETSVFGEGDAGDILIDVSETVFLSGDDLRRGETPSSIGSAVATNAVGQGGSVKISAENLHLEDESQVTAASTGRGDAGRIELRVSEQIL